MEKKKEYYLSYFQLEGKFEGKNNEKTAILAILEVVRQNNQRM